MSSGKPGLTLTLSGSNLAAEFVRFCVAGHLCKLYPTIYVLVIPQIVKVTMWR